MTGMDSRNGGPDHSSMFSGYTDPNQALIELKEEKRAIFEQCGDAIFVVNPLTREIIEANSAAAIMTGYPVAEFQEMNFDSLLPDPQISSQKVFASSTFTDYPLRAVLRRKDGTLIHVDINASAIHRGQQPLRLLFLSHADRRKFRRYFLAVEPSASAMSNSVDPISEFPNIIGKSDKIRKICQRVGQVAKTDCTVLIQGESGTGKEIVAQAIHFHSLRSKGPFVKVNCAALTETLLESELFGHVKGAFTGAIRDNKGRFMQAEGGTILLDEINCMSLAGQSKFLRVLQESEFEPVGSSRTRTVDVRVIVASNANLERALKAGKFREDLYYRLNVFPIFTSPLREKKEDIPLLARHFLRKYNLIVGKEIRDLNAETLALMMQYDWPGNVRELKNVVEHAVIVARGPLVMQSDLPTNLCAESERTDFSTGLSLRDKLNLLEKQIIVDALKRANGIKKQAAAILEIDPRNLPYLLRKHHLRGV